MGTGRVDSTPPAGGSADCRGASNRPRAAAQGAGTSAFLQGVLPSCRVIYFSRGYLAFVQGVLPERRVFYPRAGYLARAQGKLPCTRVKDPGAWRPRWRTIAPREKSNRPARSLHSAREPYTPGIRLTIRGRISPAPRKPYPSREKLIRRGRSLHAPGEPYTPRENLTIRGRTSRASGKTAGPDAPAADGEPRKRARGYDATADVRQSYS